MDIVTFKLHEQTRGFCDITPKVRKALADARTREIVVHFMGGRE